MASRPNPSEAAGRLAGGLGAHRVSLASRPLAGVGSVGRAAMRFSALTFLSRSARRRELAREAGAGRMLVRPPDYWSGQQREDEAADGSTKVQRTGDAAFDALLAKRKAVQARRAPRRSVEPRGLPSTVHRRGTSVAGAMTGPGSVLRRLTPVAVAPPPNPATTGGKLTTVSTPAPQAPRRPRGTTPSGGGARSPGSAQRSPSRAHRPPSGQPGSPATRTRTVASSSTTAGASASVAPPGQALPGLQRLERLADVATSTPDALRTPVFDALLDSISPSTSTRDEISVQSAAQDAAQRTENTRERPSIDSSVLARLADSRVIDVAHRPAVASRAARPLPVASVSVHAAAPVHAVQRRLSFTQSSALAGRSPWDAVKYQPVGGGLARSAAVAAQDLGAPSGAGRPSVHRDSASSSRPGTRELRRSPLRAASWTGDTAVAATSRGVAGRQTPSTATSSAPAARSTHGIALPRVLRRAPKPGAGVASAQPTTAGVAKGESLADAVRRVFGDPVAGTPGSIDAQPGAAVASVMRTPVVPPRGIPAQPATTTAANTPAERTAAVIPLRREAAATTTPAPSAAPTRRVSVNAFDTTMPTHPGALFSAPVLREDTAATSSSSFSPVVSRSIARPGTVLGRATTHAPLARADLARAETRVRRAAAPQVDVRRLPVAAPTTTTANATRTSDVDGRQTPPTIRRTAAAPAADATIAHEVALAVHRESARVSVRRLPLGAAGTTLPTRRSLAAHDAPDASTSTHQAPTLAQRVAALAESSSSPFELVRRVPVAPQGTVVVRREATSDEAAAPTTAARTTTRAATASTPLRRRAMRTPDAPNVRGPRRDAPTIAAAARPSAPQPNGASTPAAPARARRGSESTPAALVRRIPVASPAVATTAGRAVAPTTAPGNGNGHRATSNAAPTLAQRVAALAQADATGFDLVRRLPVGGPAAVVIAGSSPTTSTPTTAPIAAKAAPSPLALPSPAAAKVASVAKAAPLLRRSVHLPNATTAADAVAAERTTSSSNAATKANATTNANGATGNGAIPIRNPLAQRLAALTASSRTPSIADLPVGAPTAVVRRSMAIPTAPTAPVARAAAQVLPGIRATTSTPLTARRTANSSGATSNGGSTADRLRDLVASGAFDGGVPVRRMPVAPPAGAPAGSVSDAPRQDGTGRHRSGPTTVARTAAERFDEVIRRTPAARLDKPQPLPARFRPLAERIVGPKFAVKVVHGAVTRAALEAAGHEAATTNSTIHLPTRPDSSARTMSIVAHELEHVAAPSALARFHGGVDSPEERRAARTESVVRRLASQVNSRGGADSVAGVAGLPVAALPAFGRTGSAAAEGPPPPESAVQRSGADPIRRAPNFGAPAGAVAAGAAAKPNVPQRNGRPPQPARPGRGAPPLPSTPAPPLPAPPPPAAGSSESSQPPALSPAQLSAIIRAVEDRLLEEIERRGGLRRGSF